MRPVLAVVGGLVTAVLVALALMGAVLWSGSPVLAGALLGVGVLTVAFWVGDRVEERLRAETPEAAETVEVEGLPPNTRLSHLQAVAGRHKIEVN